VWATKAQIMAAFTYYQSNKYDDAIIALDRFIQLHPGHRDIPYAYYLKGLCFYEQISDVGRDQRITQQALDALPTWPSASPIRPTPATPASRSSSAIDHLAGKEMLVGRYYQKNQQYVGAINRYRTVIERYQTTTHVPEALHRLVECYLALGVQEEAKEAAAVLGHNFPGSDWYQDSYYPDDRRRQPAETKRAAGSSASDGTHAGLAFDPRLRPDREARPRLSRARRRAVWAPSPAKPAPANPS
jgi:outer membrane protein assembly factor BamD